MSTAVFVCPHCGQHPTDPLNGHDDNCPGLYASYHEVIERALEQLERLDAGNLALTPDWRQHLTDVAHELLTAAQWPSEYIPGSAMEAAAYRGSTG